MTEPLTCAKAPCKSCPYRKDVPSGVWAASEYEKLPKFDGPMVEQYMNGGNGVFMCHQQDGKLCAGWVGTHKAENLLVMRTTRQPIAPEVWEYESPVPLFASGAEAAAHGMREIDHPSRDARRIVKRLIKKPGTKEG